MSTFVQNALDLKHMDRQFKAISITSDNLNDLAGKEFQSILSLSKTAENSVDKLTAAAQETFSIMATSSNQANMVRSVSDIIERLDAARVLVSEIKNEFAEYHKLDDRNPSVLLQKRKTKLTAILGKVGGLVAKCNEIIVDLTKLMFSR